MTDLCIGELAWAVERGHPVVELREAGGERCIRLAATAEEARALSNVGRDHAPAGRLGIVLHATLSGLGARLEEVTLKAGADGLLRSCLWFAGPAGTFMLLAHPADGLLLARMESAPIRIAPADIDRLAGAARTPTTAGAESTDAAGEDADADLLAPFRSFVNSLGSDRYAEGAGA